jgi:CCR4-NOT transcription complex subunit 1
MEVMLIFISQTVRPTVLDNLAKFLYRGVLRVLLVLHHDFPEFLADYHFRLCNKLPAGCMQLRNLVLSAYPSSILELPDPFSDGLKVDRLEDIKRPANVVTDIAAILQTAGVKEAVDNALQAKHLQDEAVQPILEMLPSADEFSEPFDFTLIHAIVLYVGQKAVSNVGTSGTGPSFSRDGSHTILLCKLAKGLHTAIRYYFIGAIVNQLRYPNSHTWFFSSALLHLFGNTQSDQHSIEIRDQITRVLLERLLVHRPHPWGLIIVLLELLKNRNHMFWEQPFVKNTPEVRDTILRKLQPTQVALP